MPANYVLKLPPDRRRLAQSIKNAFIIAARSDQRQYARKVPFTPIFPNDDGALQAAIQVVMLQLDAVLLIPG